MILLKLSGASCLYVCPSFESLSIIISNTKWRLESYYPAFIEDCDHKINSCTHPFQKDVESIFN